MAIIEVNHVSKEYRLGQLQTFKQGLQNGLARLRGLPPVERELFKALDDIDFQIEEGEVVGVIGHNGAGKSTLLKILAGVSKPSYGQISVKGKVAPLIEVGAGLIGELTGRENIFLNGTILGIPRKVIERKFDEIVQFSELKDFIDTPIKRYSSGMKVRLGFAIATTVNSEILIVDEVLAVGDLAFQQKCIERMETLIKQEGRTVIIVGHNIRQLERICSRVMLLDHGRVSCDGKPREVCGIFYREAQERTFSRHEKHEGEVKAQQDTGIIKVINIDLLDDKGKPIENAKFHESLTIRVTFECKKSLERPEVVMGLHTSDFVHVLSVSNALPDMRPNLNAGVYQVTCCLSDIPLRPFSYSLRLAFLDQYRQILWYAENIKSVLVDPGIYDVTCLPEVGLIDVPSIWKFDAFTAASGDIPKQLVSNQ